MGYISLLKDAPVWGSGYAGTNILSGRAPSFMQLRLHLKPAKWVEMTWFYGWLNSMVVDSTRSYWVTNSYGTDYREVYHYKYLQFCNFHLHPCTKTEHLPRQQHHLFRSAADAILSHAVLLLQVG